LDCRSSACPKRFMRRAAASRTRQDLILHFPLDSPSTFAQYVAVRHVTERLVDPLSEPVLLILLSLASQPRHGYAILQDTEHMSNGRVRLSTGTLYGALRRLLEDAWIERYDDDDSSRGKQAYRLTTLGRRNLQMEIDRLKQITKVASLRVARKEL
jgi:DNA-binding PadR family transcriptional regulator